MRIVIDMQGVQTEGRFRGIGRYTMSLAQAIVRNRGEHDVVLALSGLFPETIEPIRASFDELLPQENISVWYAPGPVRECEPGNTWRREVAELIREAFLANLQPDVMLIPNLFVGYLNDGITSVKAFARNIFTVVALHEKLPKYENSFDIAQKLFYLRKVASLKRADLCLVSPSINVEELKKNLGFEDNRVVRCNLETQKKPAPEKIEDEALHLLSIFKKKKVVLKNGVPSFVSRRYPPKLAYVSPLPPERTEIDDYSAKLLPYLSQHYEIDVIINQSEVVSQWIVANCGIHAFDWFLQHAEDYHRILYHFGNSSYHHHMFGLAAHFPGVIILHDFFLGHAQAAFETYGIIPNSWINELYRAHGYASVRDLLSLQKEDVISKYPFNFSLLSQALGVIIHSNKFKRLSHEWYGENMAADWAKVPLLRVSDKLISRTEARRKLGLCDDGFMVCCFGKLGPTKLNQKLIDAWLSSDLAFDRRCRLIFVGQNDVNTYGRNLLDIIQRGQHKGQISISGRISPEVYREYLAAADLAVQLRTQSLGDTSTAVLDCMNYGLPTIVNSNGSMTDFPRDSVWMLEDKFELSKLVSALETLKREDVLRKSLGERAREMIVTRHSPGACARRYFNAIENSYDKAHTNRQALVHSIAALAYIPSDEDCQNVSTCIAKTLPDARPAKSLFIDISDICRTDLKTGIQRVASALILELISTPPQGYRVEPVYVMDTGRQWHYHYARQYTLSLLGCPDDWSSDGLVEFQPGDKLVSFDPPRLRTVEVGRAGLYKTLRSNGVSIYFTVYDLLPVLYPEYFPLGANERHEGWLRTIAQGDGVICISRSVADEFVRWFESNDLQGKHSFRIGWFHLGADLESSGPSLGFPADIERVLLQLARHPSFLMVGTVEPRKGHAQILNAFEVLWEKGFEVNLVIVGKKGWMVEKLYKRIINHKESNRHLFFLESISDEYLKKIYTASTCLVAASEGEGFGMPLVEAAQYKLPIIARDIPVFREVAGDFAFFFTGKGTTDIVDSIQKWLELYAQGKHPMPENMAWLTWKQSVKSFKKVIFEDNWYRSYQAIHDNAELGTKRGVPGHKC